MPFSRSFLPSCLASAGLLLATVLSPAAALATGPGEAPLAPTPPQEVRFGAVEAYTAPFHAREAGVSWERAIYRWDQFQPNSPSDWEGNQWFTDQELERELAEGRKVVGVILGTPPWLSGTDPNAAFRNLELPYDSPDNYWGQFIRRLVAQYAGRVDEWIIWNEPDIWNNSSGIQQWNGSVEQYYQLVKVAYQAGKAANPNSRIILAGLTFWWDQAFGREQYFRRFLTVAKQDPTAVANGYYFDVASIHLYGNPGDLNGVPRLFRKMMSEYGLDKPIWVNETNAVPWDDAGVKLGRDSYRASMDEQASYLIQAFASALAAGVDRVSVYKMQDDVGRPGADPYGLLRSDETASRRVSFQAFQVITQYMSGVRTARLHRQGSVAAVRMERQNDWVTVLWNLSSTQTQVAIRARSIGATLVDKYGHGSQAFARDGKFFIDLAGATANTIPGVPDLYHIGGSPLILVEPKGQLPSAMAPGQDWSAPGVDRNRVWVSHVTGYSVSGEWLDFYRARGMETLLGHPISTVRPDPGDTRQVVQYFERGVLEWHPEKPQQRVQRRLMGDYLSQGYREGAVDPQDVKARPRGEVTYFPDRPGEGLGHYVANLAPDGTATLFRDFYFGNGGPAVFGFPREEPKVRNGRWTQQFQAAVFEVVPEKERVPGGPLVRMKALGEEALQNLELPLDW